MSSMSWRIVVVSQRAKLDIKMNYLVIRGDTTTKIHITEIATLIIESTAVSITTALLAKLVNYKVKVIFCDEKRNPISELMSLYGSHDTSSKVRQQIGWSDSVKGNVWTEIVFNKIYQQMALLKQFNKDEANLLKKYLDEVLYADSTNREGHAAKVYFNALFGKSFSRTADTPVNNALNYGYSLLLSSVNREICKSGYITQLGLFHDNMFNQFNLGSDLMEPFRPIVDRAVYLEQPEVFDHEEKMKLVKILNDKVIIDNSEQYVSNAIGIYCRSVFDALNEKDISLIKFYHYEL